MKVVVYFRQAGGVAQKDYPLITHWTADENEAPIPAFSEFDTSASHNMSLDVADQIRMVNPWLEANRGFVVGIHTEIETEASRRRAYSVARKDAVHNRAVLLVATGKSIAGREFNPVSQDGLGVVVLEAPESQQRSRERWALTSNAVVYYRAPIGPDADNFLSKQHQAVQKMSGPLTILDAFIEHEVFGRNQRPRLEAALDLCREHRAFLLIGTSDAFRGGDPFEPEFTDVPYEVAYRKEYDWPDLIPVTACSYPVALLFGQQWVRGNIPLYLANVSGTDLIDVEILSRGSTLSGGEIAETATGSKTIGAVPSGHARLVEAYDVYFDGDFLNEYLVQARFADGSPYQGRAVVKDIPPSRWIEVRDQTIRHR